MKYILFIAYLLILARPAFTFELFEVPKTYETNGSVLPVSYLESLVIPDSSVILDAQTKSKVACLLMDAERVNQEKYNQTYFIKTDSPLVQLMNANFPAISELTNLFHKQGVVALSDISEELEKGQFCGGT